MWAVVCRHTIVLLTTDEKRAWDTTHAVAMHVGATQRQGWNYYMPPVLVGDAPAVYGAEIVPEVFRYEGEIAVPDPRQSEQV